MNIDPTSRNVTLQTPTRREDVRSSGARRPPPLAVLVVPARAVPRPLGLRRRLRARYGIEQFQQTSLTPAEWDAAAAGAVDRPEVERLRCRLALAQLGVARLIVVVGCDTPGGHGAEGPPRSWADVAGLVARIRSWRILGEVVGLWAGDGANPARGARPIDHHDREYDDHWLAERTWEDDGGRVGAARRERTSKGSKKGGRRRRVFRLHQSQPVHPAMPGRRRRRYFDGRSVSQSRRFGAGVAARGE